jgi:hypothetical protein
MILGPQDTAQTFAIRLQEDLELEYAGAVILVVPLLATANVTDGATAFQISFLVTDDSNATTTVLVLPELKELEQVIAENYDGVTLVSSDDPEIQDDSGDVDNTLRGLLLVLVLVLAAAVALGVAIGAWFCVGRKNKSTRDIGKSKAYVAPL